MKKYLYHGSPNKLNGETLNPSQGSDSEERPENNKLAVYATDRKDLAIVMGILGCKEVIGGSIEKYEEDKLNAKIYGDFPKQESIYIYELDPNTFIQTKIDKHQYYSEQPVKPLKIEKIRISDYKHLLKQGTEKEKEEWIKKYKKSEVNKK